MNRSIIVLGGALVSGTLVVAQDTPTLKTQNERISYALGMDLGNQLRKASIEVDPALFGSGLKDAVSGSQTLLSEEQVRAAISELQAQLKRKQAARRKGTNDNDAEATLLAAYNKSTGEAFLAAKTKDEGVVTLPSGLRYKVLKEGNGPKPALGDTVSCHYRGTLVDGTEFYNTYKSQGPMTLKVNGVIQAFTEALQLMPVGSNWELFVPPSLAYGELGSGPIGPNAALSYEVELLAIK